MKKALKIIAGILAVVIIIIALLEVGFLVEHQNEPYAPDYEKKDISDIISKENLSEEDYELILSQTGLYKIAVDAFRKEGREEEILSIQEDFFKTFEVYEEPFAPFTCSHRIEKAIATAPLENGDIIVTPSTHFSLFNVGHVAIVIDAEEGMVLNATGYGNLSAPEYIGDSTNRPSFTIMRAKLSYEERQKAVDFAVEKFSDLPYSVSIGLIGAKFSEEFNATNCSHIVWGAYKSVGIDIDSNGGPFVLPKDIAQSEHFERIQVFGREI